MLRKTVRLLRYLIIPVIAVWEGFCLLIMVGISYSAFISHKPFVGTRVGASEISNMQLAQYYLVIFFFMALGWMMYKAWNYIIDYLGFEPVNESSNKIKETPENCKPAENNALQAE